MSELSAGTDKQPDPRRLEQWLVWKGVLRDGKDKPTKIPYYPGGRDIPASATDPDTWSDYDTATQARKALRFDGVGFVFTKDDPFCGIDLDNCIDEDGELNDFALDIIEQFNSYTEYSPSGKGVHIILQGKRPDDAAFKNKAGTIECYDQGRYFTWTGRRVPHTPAFAEERQEELEEFCREHLPKKTKAINPPASRKRELGVSEEAVLEAAFASQNGQEIRALYAGSTALHGDDHSSADQALVNHLAFFSGGNPHLVDRIFRNSGLMRPKWDKQHFSDGRTYGQATVNTAFDGRTDFYTFPGKKKKHDGMTAMTPMTGDSDKDEESPPPVIETLPFPVDVFPKAAKDFALAGVEAHGYPLDFMCLPLLGMLSTAIGMSRVARIKRGYTATASLFLASVGTPGAMKSPPADLAIQPLLDREKLFKAQYAKKKDEYQRELREYEVDKSDARKNSEAAPPPPEPPLRKRGITDDTTIEALVAILESNPRGILAYQDELTGWLRGMDQYKSGGKGAERSHWLKLYDSKQVIVDRKSRIDEPIMVDAPFVTLFGGIQPAMLGEMGGSMTDGLMDRFLFAYPNVSPIAFSYKEIPEATETAYQGLINRLFQLEADQDEYGNSKPVPVPFNFEAQRRYGHYVDQITAEVYSPGFPRSRLEASWSKHRKVLARFALILSLTRTAFHPKATEEVTVEDIEGAWKLIKYFQSHARKVHGIIEKADPQEVFAGAIKTFLEAQDGQTWTGTSQELYEALEERNVSNIGTDASALGKKIRVLVKKYPDTIGFEDARKTSTRAFTIFKKPSRHAVIAVMPSYDKEETMTGMTPENSPVIDVPSYDLQEKDPSMTGMTPKTPPVMETPLDPQPQEEEEGGGEEEEEEVVTVPENCHHHKEGSKLVCWLCKKNNPLFKGEEEEEEEEGEA